MRFHLETGVLFLFVVVIGVGGCAGNAPRYVAPDGPAESLATLKVKGVTLRKIDGAAARDARQYKLAPGVHDVDVDLHDWGGNLLGARLNATFDGGRSYLLRMQDAPFDFKGPRLVIIDEQSGREVQSMGSTSILE